MQQEYISLTDIPEMHPVYQFESEWKRCFGDSDIALWERFDPISVPKLLPWMLLLRADGDGDFTYVICGERCTDMFGFSYQGKRLGEGLHPDTVAERLAVIRKVTSQKIPILTRTQAPVEGREFIWLYRGVFPFFEADGAISRICLVLAPVENW